LGAVFVGVASFPSFPKYAVMFYVQYMRGSTKCVMLSTQISLKDTKCLASLYSEENLQLIRCESQSHILTFLILQSDTWNGNFANNVSFQWCTLTRCQEAGMWDGEDTYHSVYLHWRDEQTDQQSTSDEASPPETGHSAVTLTRFLLMWHTEAG
jgi:hypothetical protein